MALSNKIRKLRFKKGDMTQKELAEQVGVSRQTINTIENNKHSPTIDVALRIADVFGVVVEDVFRREPSSEGGTDDYETMTVRVILDDNGDP